LPISIQAVYSFEIVPVVQRIEQGFPNAKTSFLQEFADVVSSAQTAVSEYLEELLRSSRVISSLPIFRQPGDTKGYTKINPVFVKHPLMTVHAIDLAK
jgi:hypothetical protein